MKSQTKRVRRELFQYKIIRAFGMNFLRMIDPCDESKSVSVRITSNKIYRSDLIFLLKKLRSLP